jgi:hypothetical protein
MGMAGKEGVMEVGKGACQAGTHAESKPGCACIGTGPS